MKYKYFLLQLLIVSMILALLPVSASAAEESLEQQLIHSCTYGQVADISQYNLTDAELEALFYQLANEGRLPWYAGNTYTYYYDQDTGFMLEFHPELLDKGRYDRMLYEQKVAEVLSACVLEGMAPWQIALAIHDYLIVNCVYDEALKLNTGYDLLVNGSTVCAGYAALYQDLLLRVGIPCIQVDSEAMDHVWNLVQLDGQWYHVDVTWDDPSPDVKGFVSHEYFLRTDAQMSAGEEPHHDWETDITCTDIRFSDAFWTTIDSQILFTDPNTCYYIRATDFENSIYRRDLSSGAEKRLYKEKETSINIGEGDYIYFHTGLSLWNERLWFCTMSKVYSMNVSGKDVRQEYAYQAKLEGRVLAGCHVVNDRVELSAADYDGNSKSLTYALEASGAHVHSYTQTVTAPTCSEPGYTVSVCQCGITARGDVTAPAGHDPRQVSHQGATFFSSGYAETVCTVCGETESTVLPQIDFWQWFDEHRRTVITVTAALVGGVCSVLSKRKKKQISNPAG